MRKILKLALEDEQITVKSRYFRFDGYEIHLYGNEKDHFELAETLDKPIVTVHYPMDSCDVYDFANEFRSDYAQKVFRLCLDHNAGLVLHAETGLDRLMTNANVADFCRFIRENGITLHIENCYRNVGAVEGLRITEYLRKNISEDLVYPLLDTCHLMMSEMSFKYPEMSFYQTMDAYTSENFKIHLNDCIGSGEKETGGIHGTNFYANQYLLTNILWKLHSILETGIDIDLILEVDEVDYIYPTNADILAKNINKIWASIQQYYSENSN